MTVNEHRARAEKDCDSDGMLSALFAGRKHYEQLTGEYINDPFHACELLEKMNDLVGKNALDAYYSYHAKWKTGYYPNGRP